MSCNAQIQRGRSMSCNPLMNDGRMPEILTCDHVNPRSDASKGLIQFTELRLIFTVFQENRQVSFFNQWLVHATRQVVSTICRGASPSLSYFEKSAESISMATSRALFHLEHDLCL
jgi:hypothetical protein